MAHTRRLEALARHLTGPAGPPDGLTYQETAGGSYNSIKVEVDGPVATITICRPKALNSLNKEVCLKMQAFRQLLYYELAREGVALLCGWLQASWQD